MVSAKSVEKQLKRVGFNHLGWGRTEVRELRNIILPDEKIYECVNGIYEGGFAMLLATDVRVLLVDKKPLNYLTVEDLRFDMINEIDYNHRLVGAYITIVTSGDKNLRFTSLNQGRLRKLIGHVQRCMAEVKKQQSTNQEGQHQHLRQINKQLRSYLVAQYEQQQKLYEHLRGIQTERPAKVAPPPVPEPVRPSPELADYLFAQGLLAQHKASTGQTDNETTALELPTSTPAIEPAPAIQPATRNQLAELYSAGMREVFGEPKLHHIPGLPSLGINGEINPLHVAYSKLPLAMRRRRFGSTSS